MPYAIDLPIGETGQAPAPRLYRALYANLLQWFDAADPTLAEALHDRPVRKPFTISALHRDPDGRWRWRVTLLEDDLFEPLWAGVQAVGEIDLNGRTWPVCWPDARVVRRSYEFLLTRVQPAERIALEFRSPTTFRQGNLDLPLPEPTAVFRSWLSHWNDFAPAQRRIDTELLEVVHERVGISDHRLRTEWHDLGYSQIVGFVGQVRYDIIEAERLNQALVWQLSALADYAEFCGTGRKTTHGMGQTRRIRKSGDF
jgi:CRISPR-associated endoribonuclease Cas6